MSPGVHHNVSREDYRALPYLNQSTLKKWLELGAIPSEFKYWRDNPPAPTEAQILGDALDCLLLDNDNFLKRFAFGPDADKRTKAWKDFADKHPNKELLTGKQMIALSAMITSLRSHDSTDVFKHCKKAVLIGQLWGVDCKAEIDLWSDKSSHMLDIKTSQDVSPKAFARDFIKFGYHYQASFYLRLAGELGIEKTVFDFIVVRNSPPWTVAVYSFAPWDCEQHSRLYDQALDELQSVAIDLTRRLQANDFADSLDWRMIEIPRYAIKREFAFA